MDGPEEQQTAPPQEQQPPAPADPPANDPNPAPESGSNEPPDVAALLQTLVAEQAAQREMINKLAAPPAQGAGAPPEPQQQHPADGRQYAGAANVVNRPAAYADIGMEPDINKRMEMRERYIRRLGVTGNFMNGIRGR